MSGMRWVGLTAFAVAACGSSAGSSPMDAGADGATPVDAGSQLGDARVGDAVSECDASGGPASSTCAIDESIGVFVAPATAGGNDSTGAGTRAAPYASIGQGIASAKTLNKGVYVCAGTYDESVKITAELDGVNVYGGLDCHAWTYAKSNVVHVAPSKPGLPVVISNLAQGVTIDDIEFDAPNATQPSGSSVAMLVAGSQNVALNRVTLVAGKGVDGAPGANAGTTANPTNLIAVSSLNGSNGTAPMTMPMTSGSPGASTTCKCGLAAGGESIGGAGGDPTDLPTSGQPVYPSSTNAGYAGINGMSCAKGGAGQDGLAAPAADPNQVVSVLGTADATGWTPSAGADGSNGMPGEGGGGGGSGTTGTGFGAGGACGGCGGTGGLGGGGGGGSIALVSDGSEVRLVGCTLKTAAAGAGGSGGQAESGQGGGYSGLSGAGGCEAGAGGAGSGGNGGGGGAGGVSVGIVYTGAAPTFDGTSVGQATSLPRVTTAMAPAQGGKGGAGGAATTLSVAGANGADGLPGVSQAVLKL